MCNKERGNVTIDDVLRDVSEAEVNLQGTCSCWSCVGALPTAVSAVVVALQLLLGLK